MNKQQLLFKKKPDCYSQAGRVANRSANHGNDKLTGLILKPYDENTNPAITIFENWNCQGDSAAFFAGPTGSELRYSKEDMGKNRMPSDWASSILVPHNVVVTLYDGAGFDGDYKVIDGA